MGAAMQAELMYPHIATTDAKASTNATWLRTLTNRSFHFDQWADEKAFKAAVGPKGEKAIFNGDILPSPAGLPFSLRTAKLFGGSAGDPCVGVLTSLAQTRIILPLGSIVLTIPFDAYTAMLT